MRFQWKKIINLGKGKGLTNNAKTIKGTGYRPKNSNITRWSSALEIVKPYTQARDAVEEPDLPDVDNLLPATAQTRRLDTLTTKMKDLESGWRLLQSNDATLANVRGVFEYLTDTYPLVTTKRSANANIVAFPTFKSTISRI